VAHCGLHFRDLAGRLAEFWNVTIPMLSPTLLLATIMSFVGPFQIFEPMFIITAGGPGSSTLSVIQLVYSKAFREFDMGYACAIALVVVLIIMAVTLLQLWLSRKWVNYERA
jgi:multiple sugar transport system permease protein